MASNEASSSRSSQLRQRAVEATTAFVNVTKGVITPQDFLSSQFTSDPRITEHGPAWSQSVVPIFGKTYKGEGCIEYFEILDGAFTAHFAENSFPGPKEVVVDAEAKGPDDRAGKARGVIWMSGHASFTNKKNGKTFKEIFAIRLSGFDGHAKIGHWEFWGDTLSAYAAVEGWSQLD